MCGLECDARRVRAAILATSLRAIARCKGGAQGPGMPDRAHVRGKGHGLGGRFAAVLCTCLLCLCLEGVHCQISALSDAVTRLAGCVAPDARACAAHLLPSTLAWAAFQATGKSAVSSSTYTTACTSGCSIKAALQASLSQAAAQGDGCSMFRNSSSFPSFFEALQTFLCMPSSSSSSGSSNAGCGETIAAHLQESGLQSTLGSMLQPNLMFTGATLSSVCQALMPSTGCCFRSWALLMSAFARQLCFEQLAIEYLSLPGRCQILQNSNPAPACVANWQATLTPLLTNPALGSCSTRQQQQSLAWLSGSTCPSSQNQAQTCFSTVCDMWCVYFNALSNYLLQAPAPAPQNSGLSDQVKAFVIAFPVLVFCCLLAFLAWLYWECVHSKRKPQRKRPAPAATTYTVPVSLRAEDESSTPQYGADADGAPPRGVAVLESMDVRMAAEGDAPAQPPAASGSGVLVVVPSSMLVRPSLPHHQPSVQHQAATAEEDAVSFVTARESLYGTARASSTTPSFVTAQDRSRSSEAGSGQSSSYASQLWRSMWSRHRLGL